MGGSAGKFRGLHIAVILGVCINTYLAGKNSIDHKTSDLTKYIINTYIVCLSARVYM